MFLPTLPTRYAARRNHWMFNGCLAWWKVFPNEFGQSPLADPKFYDLAVQRIGTPTNLEDADWKFKDGRPCIDCGGTNEFVSAANMLSGSTACALMAWINRGSNYFFLGERNDSGGVKAIEIEQYPTVTYLNAAAAGQYGEFANSASGWFHVALVFNGAGSGNSGRLQGYKDGVQQTLAYTGTIPAAIGNTSANPFCINKRNSAVGAFGISAFDDVRVYNRALTAAEISAIYADSVTQRYEALTIVNRRRVLSNITSGGPFPFHTRIAMGGGMGLRQC